MTKEEKVKFLTSPEIFWPKNIIFHTKEVEHGNVVGNTQFVNSLCTHVKILQESQYWDPCLISHIQSSRLQKLVKYIRKNSPLWSAYLKKYNFDVDSLNILNELTKLPVLERTLYSRNTDTDRRQWYIIPKDLEMNIMSIRSGGTTAQPLTIIRTTQETAIMRFPDYFRCDPIFKTAILRNLCSRKFIVALGGGGFMTFLSDFVHTIFRITHTDLRDQSVRKKIYKTIQEAGPIILGGYSSLLLKLVEYIQEDGVNLPLIAARPCSEPIPLEDRDFMKKVLNVPILNTLNYTEGGSIGFECSQNIGNFHINSERVILEVVNEKGESLEVGKEGNLVVTILDSFTSPLIRYQVGDIGKMKVNVCTCGRKLPLFEFQGRRSEELQLPSGDIVKSILLYGGLLRSGLGGKTMQFQLQQTAPNKLHLLVIPRNKFTETDEIHFRMVITKLLNNEKMIIYINQVSHIPYTPSGKSQFFIPLKTSP